MAETIKIGGELESVATGNIVARTHRIYDNNRGKYQSDINAETAEALEHTLYKSVIDLTSTVLSEEVDAEEQEYRDGRWHVRGQVRVDIPHRGDYMLRLFNTAGGEIHVGSNYYTAGHDINITYEGVEEVMFEAEEWVSMDSLVLVEYLIDIPTKLSELEQDIIWAEGDTMYVKE